MRRIAILVVVFALMAPSVALGASGATCQAYNPQLCSALGSENESELTASSTTGTLPFTGLDLVLLVAGGGALLSAGFVVRRLSRQLN